MLEPELVTPVESTVRGIATAARVLRLYPPASPIPRQSVDAATEALATFLRSESSLVLDIAREGFTCRGTLLSSAIAGGQDLAEMMSSHGIAQVVFTPGCRTDDLLGFLGVIMRAPEIVRSEGGVMSVLGATGCSGIRIVTVSLTVTGQVEEPLEGQDVDDFFRELAADPEKLATWLAASSSGDPATLAEGLGELANAAGPDRERFLANLALAFGKQENDAKDVLLGIGMEAGGARDLVGGMLAHLPGGEVSDSLTAGLFGKNMLSLSTALTRLPFGPRLDEIVAEVRASLPNYGHDERESQFLDHMLSVRSDTRSEPALIAANATYGQIAAAASFSMEALTEKRAEVAKSVARTAAHSVPTMLALLDQQSDFNLYVRSLDALASVVPQLVREGDLALAVTVLREISERENRPSQPWPELTQRLRAAMMVATGRRTMGPLLEAIQQDPSAVAQAQEVLRLCEDTGKVAFVEAALARHETGALDVAESLLGRRMIDLLAAVAPKTNVALLDPLVRRLARHPDPAATQAIHDVLRRPDEMARAEGAEALAGTTNPLLVRHLAAMLKDPSMKVVSAAARSLCRTRLPGTAEAIAERLESLDVDNKDFALARELIGCLAQMPERAAGQALQRLADRKVLIKRGRFGEVQQLAREALAVQTQRGGAR